LTGEIREDEQPERRSGHPFPQNRQSVADAREHPPVSYTSPNADDEGVNGRNAEHQQKWVRRHVGRRVCGAHRGYRDQSPSSEEIHGGAGDPAATTYI